MRSLTRFRWLAVGLLVAVGIALALVAVYKHSAGTPECLIVLEGALDIRNGGSGGMKEVTYCVADPYPVKSIRTEMSGRLSKMGWKRLRDGRWSADMPPRDAEGWTTFDDGSGGSGKPSYHWVGWWTDGNGNNVMYSLTHMSQLGGSGGKSGWQVHAMYVPKDVKP